MLNIVCINAGNYQGIGAEYVNALCHHIKDNCTENFEFTCFTDDEYLLTCPETKPIPEENLSGWWNKVALFKPGVFERGDRVLYLDLSAIPRKNIDALAGRTEPFIMVQPFGASGPFGGLQSSVMAWTVSERTEAIWEVYEAKGRPQDWPGGDQAFIEAFGPHDVWSWDEIIPGAVRSWKWHKDGDDPIVQVFHGHPKPHELPGWPGDIGLPVFEEAVIPAKFVNVCNTPDSDIASNILGNAWRKIPRVRSRLHGAVVVGGGPSASQRIEDIAAKQDAGAAVFALNGAAGWLRARDIIPDFHVILDARRDNIDFLRHIADRDPYETRKTVHLLAAQCHPDLFALLEEHDDDVRLWHDDDVRLWHVDVGEDANGLLRAQEPGAHLFSIGSTVGVSVLNLILAMGYRSADLYGYDSSNAHAVHHAYAQFLNDSALTDEYIFNGHTYVSPRAMASQAKQFIDLYQRLETAGLKVAVHGEGLLPDMWRHEEEERARAAESLEATEAYKYRRCWSHGQYREHSDGENLLAVALEALRPRDGTTFIDFGCGTGRATSMLQVMGHKVLGIDHASNSLDDGINIPFCVANLWALPPNINEADYGYCVDVMEHIPRDKIDAVLSNISRLSNVAAFFKIDLEDAKFGDFIGVGTLHHTIMSSEWWMEQLSKHFSSVEPYNYAGVFICRK